MDKEKAPDASGAIFSIGAEGRSQHRNSVTF
jgi:hypothetical protein